MQACSDSDDPNTKQACTLNDIVIPSLRESAIEFRPEKVCVFDS